ncbi:MAG: hypothetical protein V1728_05745 [Candidatus Micrarchaeota archaeon]
MSAKKRKTLEKEKKEEVALVLMPRALCADQRSDGMACFSKSLENVLERLVHFLPGTPWRRRLALAKALKQGPHQYALVSL